MLPAPRPLRRSPLVFTTLGVATLARHLIGTWRSLDADRIGLHRATASSQRRRISPERTFCVMRAATASGEPTSTIQTGCDEDPLKYHRRWRNRVPKAERQESLQLHLRSVLRKMSKTDELKRLLQSDFLHLLEQRVEEANPDTDEEQISVLCHKKIRKFGNSLRLGWELELLGLDQQMSHEVLSRLQRGARDHEDNYKETKARRVLNSVDWEPLNASAVLDRLDTIGHQKLANYKHIKRGDRRGPQSLRQRGELAVGEDTLNETTTEAYGNAITSQRTTLWHQKGLAAATAVFHQAGTQRLLDIGSSFNPLRDEFPSVTAIDVVPTHDSVLMGNILEVEFFSPKEVDSAVGIDVGPKASSATIVDGRCVALQRGGFDGVLLSFVLRAVVRVGARREMVRRAAEALEVGGVFVVVERSSMKSLLKYASDDDPQYADVGLRWIRTQKGSRGVQLHVFRRVEISKPSTGALEQESPHRTPEVVS